MKWRGREKSQNVDDRRGQRGSMVRPAAGLGIGTLLIVLLFAFLGGDPSAILNNVQQGQQQQAPTGQVDERAKAATQELADFVSVVLKDTEDVWNKLFPEQLGRNYVEPTLVLFEGEVTSACGFASAATGPFYCPGDQKLYIDLSFYQELKNKFKAPGDFAMAYVVAHEAAHHVQNLLGITRDVQSKRRSLPEAEYNKLSVRLELQADFLAGVWAHHGQRMNRFLEDGDIEEAMNAAHAIGDDTIQKRARGYVVPDSFSHGTSEQRIRWFRKGLETGDLRQGDTFAVRYSDL